MDSRPAADIFGITKTKLNESGTMIKFLLLDFLGVSHIEFYERMKTPFTVCKYLH